MTSGNGDNCYYGSYGTVITIQITSDLRLNYPTQPSQMPAHFMTRPILTEYIS